MKQFTRGDCPWFSESLEKGTDNVFDFITGTRSEFRFFLVFVGEVIHFVRGKKKGTRFYKKRRRVSPKIKQDSS
jgi:hypothetical protein